MLFSGGDDNGRDPYAIDQKKGNSEEFGVAQKVLYDQKRESRSISEVLRHYETNPAVSDDVNEDEEDDEDEEEEDEEEEDEEEEEEDDGAEECEEDDEE